MEEKMACRGVLFAITEEQKTDLLKANSDSEVLSIVQDGIEEDWDEENLVQTDKAWDAIHRCLTDGNLCPNGGSAPLNLCILGGKSLHIEDSYIIVLKEPSEVQQISKALASISHEWMRKKYFLIDAEDFGPNFGEEDFEYTWAYFEDLQQFYAKAAIEGRSVIFTVDQ
jgi:hypothetical protein